MIRIPGKERSRNFLLEILMIVVGINVALWFEGWFQDRQDAEIARQYLADLRTDLRSDIEQLDNVIRNAEAKMQQIGNVVKNLDAISELSAEEQAQTIFAPSSYLFFDPSDYTHRSMQESGDFRLLKDSEIKKHILRLARRHKNIAEAQKNFLQALDDEYIPLMMSRFDIATMQVTDPGLFSNQVFRNFFVYTMQDTSAMIEHYGHARLETDALIGLINAALGNADQPD